MSVFDKYFTGECSISLEKVGYNKLDEIESDVSLRINDCIAIKENKYDWDKIEFIISRNLSFEPRSLVEIDVSFGVILELNEKYKGSKQLDYKSIISDMISEDCVITSIIMSRISLLISQLTSSYGERPIVTPPSFIKN